MSKQYNIRWGRSDYARLAHLVKKVNQKIFDIEVKRPDIAGYQPDMLDYQSAKSNIKTRQDFNKFLNKYKRYLREGVEEVQTSTRGAKATGWEINEFNIDQRVVNAQRARKRKKIENEEVKIGGVSTGSTRRQMGSVKDNSLKPSRKKFNNLSQKEWELARKNFDRVLDADKREKKNEEMRENYLKGLLDAGFLEANPELETYIRGVSFDDFFANVETDETASFQFYKDPVAWDTRLEYISNSWRSLYEKER